MTSDRPKKDREDAVAAVDPGQVTRLLDELHGSPELFDQLVPLVYDDLKRLGRAQRWKLGGSVTLQTTALVHEAFIKLRGHAGQTIESRLHFQRLAARVIRQLIVDYARKQLAAKRGGDQARETFEDSYHAAPEEDLIRVLAIEEAIARVELIDSRLAEVLAASLHSGYTVTEIGQMLDISSRTVVRDLKRARAWLRIELADFDPS
ncbi:MAG TPA: ECF-type sigma factor [Wenzhouxiangellaceae bacterium]|nr:ECF-type sigma factor [Wenzhouxiangellaceae bacterium]